MDRLLLGERRFGPLFFTQFLGALNDNFFKNALVILITYKSVTLLGLESGALVAAAGGIFILPFFLFSATAGQLADHYDKSFMVRVTKITELLFMSLAALGFIWESYELLFVVLFCMGAQSAFFGPLKYGILPEVLSARELVKGNSLVAAGTFVAILLGTIMGGKSAAVEGALTVISIGVILLSFIGLLLGYLVPATNRAQPELKINWNFFASTGEIIKMSRKDKNLFRTLMGVSWFWFLGAGVLSLLPVYVKDILGGSEEVATLFLAIFTVGMGLGAYICQLISREKSEVGVSPIAGLLMSFFLIDLWLTGYGHAQVDELLGLDSFLNSSGSLRAMIDLFFMSTFGGLFIIPQMTSLQEEAPAGEVARYIAANNIWNALFMVIVSVFIMVLYAVGMTSASVFAILGVMNLLFSFLLYAWRSEKTLRFIGQALTHSFYKLKVKGREHMPHRGPFIIVSNHVSFIDWLFLMAVAHAPVRFVIDHNYYYKKGLPFWLRQARLIPIAPKRESEERLGMALENISLALREGAVLGFFPEGFLTRDGKMRRFQPGLARILRQDPVPVVPLVIKGLWGSTFSHEGAGVFKKWNGLRRRVVEIEIMPAIEPRDYDSKSLHEVMRTQLGEVESERA